MSKKNLVLILIVVLFTTCFLFNTTTIVKAAEIEESDPKEDMYEITFLDFFYVVGDEFPNRPNSVDDVKDVLNKMVSRSTETNRPDSADIDNAYINTNDPNWTAVIIEMEDDIKDLDYLMIIVVLEHSENNWIELEMEYDGGTEDYEWTSENFEGNDTTGGISGKQIGIAFPISECDYREDDDFIVISYAFEGDFDDPFQSMFYYDFCPNSAVDVEEQGIYQGPDLITAYISQLAHFLFGWVFTGFLPFLVLIALFLALFQFLADRRSKLVKYAGIILL